MWEGNKIMERSWILCLRALSGVVTMNIWMCGVLSEDQMQLLSALGPASAVY